MTTTESLARGAMGSPVSPLYRLVPSATLRTVLIGLAPRILRPLSDRSRPVSMRWDASTGDGAYGDLPEQSVSREMQLGGDGYQFGQRSRLHFPHHTAAMSFHCDFADSELVRNLLVPQTRDNQVHNLTFAVAEPRVTLLQRRHF